MLSVLGLANDPLLAQRSEGIDVILSSDILEETPDAVVVTTSRGGRTILVRPPGPVRPGRGAGPASAWLDSRARALLTGARERAACAAPD